MKTKVVYTCKNCAYDSGKWLGRCPQCNEWNTFDQEGELVNKNPSGLRQSIKAHAREPYNFSELLLKREDTERQKTGVDEIDRVFGGGIVEGSLTLITGEPGIGKSTLILQIAEKLTMANKNVLYISGEESEKQVALRGKRLGLKLNSASFLCETLIETVIATAEAQKSQFLIIDSIQVMYSDVIPSAPGTVTQVRTCTEKLMHFAKSTGVTVFIIGHVTKDGTLAGPRVLEHLVDTVMYVEGSRTYEARLVRCVKNRFGSVSEVGVFEMTGEGLVPVTNASEFFVEHLIELPIGAALTLNFEGTRPLLFEIQALTNKTVFGYPQRTARGIDSKRLQLLLATLEKHLNVSLGQYDVYVNVVGGYTIQDPSADLAVCAAILSSLKQRAMPNKSVFVGEVGLIGSIRMPKNLAQIKKESTRMQLKPALTANTTLSQWAAQMFAK